MGFFVITYLLETGGVAGGISEKIIVETATSKVTRKEGVSEDETSFTVKSSTIEQIKSLTEKVLKLPSSPQVVRQVNETLGTLKIEAQGETTDEKIITQHSWIGERTVAPKEIQIFIDELWKLKPES